MQGQLPKGIQQSVTALSDVTKAGSGEIITNAERTKLSGPQQELM